MTKKEDVLEIALRESWDERFVQGMKNRIKTSHFKYGATRTNFPHKVNAIASAQLQIQAYNETHNTEYLIDAANYLLFEFMWPAYKDAKFAPGDSHQSAGKVDRRFMPK